MSPRSTLTLCLCLLALSVVPALAAAPAGDAAPLPAAPPELTTPPVPAAAGGCAPGLVLDAALVTPAPEAPVADALEPEWLQGPPGLRKYCRCGCGIGCQTSADCGGDPCQAFITCC